MSEWLTTGQMIDRLKVGEVAENQSGMTKVFYDFPTRTLVYDIEGNLSKKCLPFDISMDSVNERWRILPKYVTFEEAMKARREGKGVKFHYENGTIYIGKGSKMKLKDSWFASKTFDDLVEGKWTIKED
ncbi:hypothetical protein [Bacillus litorisediminis]|uniref:hypothetical protein n=1 Tax=Bacillus litorisediminis TaxID=2922713 RepID=UPI001FAE23FB|nr:hypothetical protein [Bacillus litorisediminis]